MSLHKSGTTTAALFSVLAGSSLFGTSGVAMALGPAGAPAAMVGATRVLVGGICLLVAAVFTRERFRVSRSRPWTSLLLGISVAIYQTCYFGGIGRVGVAIGAVATVTTVPVATGVVAFLLRGERPSRRWYPATLLAIAGSACADGVLGRGAADPVGLLLCVTAGTSVAVYTVLSRTLMDDGARAAEVTTIALAVSGLLLLPILIASDPRWLATASGLTMTAYLGVCSCALGFWLNARGLRRLPATKVATLNLAEPVTAVILALLILGERPSALQLAGIALVCVALAMLSHESPADTDLEDLPSAQDALAPIPAPDDELAASLTSSMAGY
jgi:drug/metabolite transporter, DME family